MIDLRETDKHREITPTKDGLWQDRATLYEARTVDGNGLYLRIEGGLLNDAFDSAWYKLGGRPAGSLRELLSGNLWARPDQDQSELLTEGFGVAVTKLKAAPEDHGVAVACDRCDAVVGTFGTPVSWGGFEVKCPGCGCWQKVDNDLLYRALAGSVIRGSVIEGSVVGNG